MKRLFRIFELSKNEQRVALIVMLALIVIASVSYQRRVHHPALQPPATTESKASPSPVEAEGNQ